MKDMQVPGDEHVGHVCESRRYEGLTVPCKLGQRNQAEYLHTKVPRERANSMGCHRQEGFTTPVNCDCAHTPISKANLQPSRLGAQSKQEGRA